MTKWRNLLILAVVTAGVVALAYSTQTRDGGVAEAGELVFPDLLDRVNDVATVTVLSEGETFDVVQESGRWVVPAKSGYPANPDTVHLLVVGAASLARVEPKTSNPDLYSRLGLEDPSTAGSTSARYVLKASGGDVLADLLVGNRSPAKTNPSASEIYVRIGDDVGTWLVEGKLPEDRKAIDWIAPTIIEIDRERVHRVVVEHPDGERIEVEKPSPESIDFALLQMPEGAEVDGQWKLNDIGRVLTTLELDDVSRDALDALGPEPGPTVTMHTYDGLAVTLRTRTDGEKTFGVLEAAYDASLRAAGDAARADPGDDPKAGAALELLKDENAVGEEAKALSERWQGWTYEVPKFKADYLAKRVGEMTKVPEAEEAGPAAETTTPDS